MVNRVNIKNKLIVLKRSKSLDFKDATKEITAVYKKYYYGNFSGYTVYFKNNSNYFYTKDNIRIFDIIAPIDISNKIVYLKHVYIDAIEVYNVKPNQFIIKSASKLYLSKNVKFVEKNSKNLKDNPELIYYAYYKNLAYYAESISNTDEPLYFLAKQYSRASLKPSSILNSYFKGVFEYKPYDQLILAPYSYNMSQLKAIETALKSNISVIEGPPGTGKTQTILNLIANIIIQNKTVAVVSNNNTAIENVYEKLDQSSIKYIAARLGSSMHVEHFFDNVDNQAIENLLKEKPNHHSANQSKISQLHLDIKMVKRKELEVANLRKTLNHIQTEYHNFKYITFQKKDKIYKMSTKRINYLYEKLFIHQKLNFFTKLKLKWLYKINPKKDDLSNIIYSLEDLMYNRKIRNLKHQIDMLEASLEVFKKHKKEEELSELSLSVFNNYLYNHYKGLHLHNFTSSRYKLDYKQFTKRFPVVLSTTQSLAYNMPVDYVFDYLIIDEASQGDLLSSIQAMNCAKNVVVIGDSKQLEFIEEKRLVDEASRLATLIDVPDAYRYDRHSILSSVKQAVGNVPTTLLREHYRSAPAIIEFCNQMFYDGKLISMNKNTGTHLEIIKTVPGNHARKNPYGSGLYNQREVDEIKNLLLDHVNRDVGVITPFRYQAQMILNSLNDSKIEVDTVHRFQGRQKEEIILSFVVNNLNEASAEAINKIDDFITNRSLLNVAISRAKHKVTLIVSDQLYHSKNNIIKALIQYVEYMYKTKTTRTSKIKSAFDYLYEVNKDSTLKLYKNNNKLYQSELLMLTLIKNVIKDFPKVGFMMHQRLSKIIHISSDHEHYRYLSHPWTHVDFLFYHKVTKENLFVLEVDGIRYHEQQEKQRQKDVIKDQVLAKNGVEVHRFKTNESNEVDRLKRILSAFDY